MPRYLWTQKQDFGPRPRRGHAMTYDAERKRVVLFGGESHGARVNDTWEWDGQNWTQVADIGPGPRSDHAMAFDHLSKHVVLFGGNVSSGEPGGDTWEWDGSDWTQLADEGPAPRAAHSLVADVRRRRVVLFGGSQGTTSVFADTWVWDGTEWTQESDTGPSRRRAHAAAYDTLRERIVLFGGYDGPAEAVLGDTWEWDGTAWMQLADFGPTPRARSAMAFAGGRVILFGGSAPSERGADDVFNDTWEWTGRLWKQRQDIGPHPRWSHAMSYDTVRKRVVIFGGQVHSLEEPDVAADSWEYPDNEASLTDGPPAIVSLDVVGYDPMTRQGTGVVTVSHIAGGSLTATLTSSHAVVFAPPSASFHAAKLTDQFTIYVDLNIPFQTRITITASTQGFSRTTELLV